MRFRGLLIAGVSGAVLLAAGPLVAEEKAVPAKGTPQAAAQGDEDPQAKVIDAIVRAAFGSTKIEAAPLNPAQTREIIRLLDEVERAEGTALPPQKTVKHSQPISLEPNNEPAAIKVGAGYSTTLAFFDATGQPWPIESFNVGNPKGYTAEKQVDTGHWLVITPIKRYRPGNITIKLKDLATLVSFDFVEGSGIVHSTFNALMPTLGPNAKAAIIDGQSNIAAADAVLMTFLQGVPPAGAVRLNVSGADGRTSAWEYKGSLYLRTPHSLLSPEWQGQVALDNYTAYRIEPTASLDAGAPRLLLSDEGTWLRLRVIKPAGNSATRKEGNG